MATASVAFKSREDHRKQIELEEARKAGLAPAELDEDGKEINPHIPQYMSSAPWYLNAERPSLKHQRKWKSDPNYTKSWYDRGAKIFQAEKYRKGACENCGAMTHNSKSCMERPRKKGAKWTSMHIAPDEKIESFELDYDGKRDRWNGYDASTYARVIERYEARDEARKKYLKDQQLRKLEEKNSKEDGENAVSDEDDDEDDLRVDEAKVDESKQMDFAKVEKRVRTTGGGSTGTVRNLRIREDTAKYLLNLDVNSAHYDPKTRSMREDPLPDADPNEKFYLGDNQYRHSGQALEFKQLNMHSWEAFEKGQDIHMQAAPSQAELLYKNYKVIKEKLKHRTKDTIMEKYGNAANEEEIPRELLLGQSEKEVEYDRAGRIIKGQEAALPKSKYEEDVHINNHTSVWGSWWKDHQWGYKCCRQTVRNSYCTGAAGIEAAEAATDLMKANIARREATEDLPAPVEERRLASWGTEVPEDLVLDEKLLAEALKREDNRKREERDERKRKYNVKWNDEVTHEDMEAYRMKRFWSDKGIKDSKLLMKMLILCEFVLPHFIAFRRGRERERESIEPVKEGSKIMEARTINLLLMLSFLLTACLVESRYLSNTVGGGFSSVEIKDNEKPFHCVTFYGVESGNTCDSIIDYYKSNAEAFYHYNPNINCEDLFIGQWVCVNGGENE
ncbi:pre-mRNA-splicing factor SLU7 [Tripterygium wilfordii]|uniref:Pre-mRNA-splicing factor SLU7 n=2 Tax=Tripterygium wilfordii TaxID=458696 RepID=A0A7J7D6B1_TRIWF|nr:pre-mRNA-splicing factor SLU7 [Tripterygium wilfordii]